LARRNHRQLIIQSISAILQNANFKGFFTGKLYTGETKKICVPGLNCYSCPGAVGACPIGSLQNTLSGYTFKFPYYVLGLMIFFGAVFGRMICGFLCPFGLLQDILYKIPFPKKIRTFRGDRVLRKLKYAVLIIMVIVLPVICKLTPVYCKYLCPSGTLSGILLAFSDTKLFSVFGSLFAWKACVLATVILTSIIIARPFCRYLCPLGAFYGIFNKISAVQIKCDKSKCSSCGACTDICQMAVSPPEKCCSPECIRCGKCVSVCGTGALKFTSVWKTQK